MFKDSNYTKLAQSASAIGAAILGFGLGSKWGVVVSDYANLILITGAIIHVWGMYILQMRTGNKKINAVSTALWISAWLCLIILVGIVLYLLIKRHDF